jgi:hypothetical protein
LLRPRVLALCLAVVVLWCLWCADSPQRHPRSRSGRRSGVTAGRVCKALASLCANAS